MYAYNFDHIHHQHTPHTIPDLKSQVKKSQLKYN